MRTLNCEWWAWAAGVLTAAAFLSVLPCHGATRYRLEDLGTLGSAPGLPVSMATAVNGGGVTVGLVRDGLGKSTTPVVFAGGGPTPVGLPAGFGNGSAYGVNAVGAVVGEARADAGNTTSAFVFSGSTADLLPTPAGDVQAEAFSVNDAGVASGASWDAAGHSHAVLWSGGVNASLHAVFGGAANSEVVSSVAGLAAGSADDAASAFHALRYDGTTVTALDGLPGFDATFARAMNGAGDIVGESTSDAASHALLWPHGSTSPTDLGALAGFAWISPTGVNAARTVVGTAGDGPYQLLHGFVYDGAMYDLNSELDPTTGAGWTVNAALGINDAGVIVGWGTNGTQQHAIRLTPLSPSNALLIAAGIIGSSSADLAALDVVAGTSAGRIDTLDAARLARKSAGLDP